MEHTNAWTTYSKKDVEEVFRFGEDYKKFISANKTEREVVSDLIKQAEECGYTSLEQAIKENRELKPNDKVWACHHSRLLMLVHVGSDSIVDKGLNILGAHCDSPRLDIKQNPLYQQAGICLFETHYYGGINMYQWINIPMELRGIVCTSDGKKIDVSVGANPDEPVFFINDLLIHLSSEYTQKPAKKFIDPEKMDLLVGSRPLVEGLDVPTTDKHENSYTEPYNASEAAKPFSNVSRKHNQAITQYLLKMLYDNYGLYENALKSAELEVVPSGRARDCGFDRSMIVGYGHDDRSCVYPSAIAQFALQDPKKTCVCIFTDKEEIGSLGATSMESKFFENTIAEVLELTGEGQGKMLNTRRALSRSSMLSSDVSAAFDPMHTEVFEPRNSCFMGDGLVFNKYGGSRGKRASNDASPEFCAKVGKIIDNAGVISQTAELGAVDAGGGGTIAYIPANFGMDVIDCGLPVLSMHCPWEVISKADLYEAFKGYYAFLKDA